MNKMDCITVYLYLRHVLNITRDEERVNDNVWKLLEYWSGRYQASMAYQHVHT